MNRYEDDIRITEKVKQIVKDKLPGFASRYFNDNLSTKTPRSLYGYALDLTVFFDYLSSMDYNIPQMTIDDLNKITPQIIENYMFYIQTYMKNGSRKEASAASQRRKYASLSSFFNYYYKLDMIDHNPFHKVESPKQPKYVTQAPTNEINYEMLDYIAYGKLDGRAAIYNAHTKDRDLAMILLIIGAGFKVSDLVNLDIDDIHLEDNSIELKTRKSRRTVYISDTIADAVDKYFTKRINIIAKHGDVLAFFLSLQGRRICARAIQNIIKKYSSAIFDGKHHLTGEALALSFQNNVFKQTKNIYLASAASGKANITVLDRYRPVIEQYSLHKGTEFEYLNADNAPKQK